MFAIRRNNLCSCPLLEQPIRLRTGTSLVLTYTYEFNLDKALRLILNMLQGKRCKGFAGSIGTINPERLSILGSCPLKRTHQIAQNFFEGIVWVKALPILRICLVGIYVENRHKILINPQIISIRSWHNNHLLFFDRINRIYRIFNLFRTYEKRYP